MIKLKKNKKQHTAFLTSCTITLISKPVDFQTDLKILFPHSYQVFQTENVIINKNCVHKIMELDFLWDYQAHITLLQFLFQKQSVQ